MLDIIVQIKGQMKLMMPLPKENIYGHKKKLFFILEELRKYINKKGNDKIILLDYGCGNGSAVSQYLIGENILYYGVDVHEPCLQYAREHYSKEDAHFVCDIPEGLQFDVIVYADVLEHLTEPRVTLQDHFTRLKNQGIIIGAIPNGYGPFEIEKRLDRWLGLSQLLDYAARVKRKVWGGREVQAALPPYNLESGHLQFFTKKRFFATLQGAGFQVIRFAKGAFLGAPFSERLILRGERIARANARLADFLPDWAVSTWYFVAEKSTGKANAY